MTEMNTAVNNAPKKAQLNIIFIGREGKMRVCRMRADLPGAKASNSVYDVPKGLTLRQGIMQGLAEEILKAAKAFSAQGRQVAIEVYTVGQVAIKYYQMVPYLKGGHFMTDKEIEAICSERDTTEDRCAYADLAEAIAKTVEAGHSVHLQASGNADVFELIVPEGVNLDEGQLLDFTDGVSPEGVMVRGWRNCNRKGAKVIARGIRKPRGYISKAADPDKPWRGLEVLLTTIDACWNSLPRSVDKSKDDINEDALYAA